MTESYCIVGPAHVEHDVPLSWNDKPSTLYNPQTRPPPTRFPIKCHPKADEICAELDDYFLKFWPFASEDEKNHFVACQYGRWECLALPLVSNERILDACKVNTLLFLLDDVAEDMTVEEGKQLYTRLMLLAQGKTLPSEDGPYDKITYDIWASMRECDEQLTVEVLRQACVCFTAQVDETRMGINDLGTLLKQRAREGGIAFVEATMRYGMSLRMSATDLESVDDIVESYGKLGIIVNDIYSFDKEIEAWQSKGQEGAKVLNMVQTFSEETGLSYDSAKRILWLLCREWEISHREMVEQRLGSMVAGSDGANVRAYLEGLEYILSGNEVWSETSPRYHKNKV